MGEGITSGNPLGNAIEESELAAALKSKIVFNRCRGITITQVGMVVDATTPENATDGDYTSVTGWAYEESGNIAYIKLDLGAIYLINNFYCKIGDKYVVGAGDITFEHSLDDSSWDTLIAQYNNALVTETILEKTNNNYLPMRYIRIRVKAGAVGGWQNHVRIYEMIALGVKI